MADDQTTALHMEERRQRVEQDLDILEAMATSMEDYLDSDVLFYPLPEADMPRLTMGGYLMRQHRLYELRDNFDTLTRQRLDTAMQRFRDATVGHNVRVEQRAVHELQARIRQWQEYLNELHDACETYAAYYAASVEARVMMSALINYLRQPPSDLPEDLLARVAQQDELLSQQWQKGPFVWPDVWQPAYPQQSYWWLHGNPVPVVQ